MGRLGELDQGSDTDDGELGARQPSSRAGVSHLDITAELDRRPVRAPDCRVEAEALLELMRALKDADADTALMQKLAETALKLCRAHTAGVTIEEQDHGRSVVRCHGVAGQWSRLLGKSMDRSASISGFVLDRQAPVLMAYPEANVALIDPRVSPVVEALMVPLKMTGATVGTIWVIAHDATRPFDREDLRLLTNLSEYASVAYQVLLRRAQLQDALAKERRGSQLLQAISAGLIREPDADALYRQILDAAMTIMSADFASMQMLGEGELRLLAHRGFDARSVQVWTHSRLDAPTPCTRAMRRGERVIVVDIEQDKLLAGSEALEELRRTGVRAMQSTPLTCRSGEQVGVLSTHWRAAHEPCAYDLRLCDVLARLAADLIERARTDQALREMDRRKNEFLAVLSHELRSPLAPITTGLELICRVDGNPELIQSVHAMMCRQVSHLTRLVNDLLDLSRITRDTIELQRAPLDLRVVVQSAVERARPLIDQRKHVLTVEHAGRPLPLDGDQERLTQVVANILSNAAKYSDAGSQILLRTSAQGSLAVIQVRDTGFGIPAAKLEQVFEMFTQVPEHRSRSGGNGLGVGLALSRRLIELHGGSIEARSEGLGHGSEFVIRLPLAARTAVAAAAGGRSIAPGAGSLVLIIEDNVDAARTLQVALESSGHTVQVAHDGRDGLSRLDMITPDVVLLDIGLPGVDGYEVARQIRMRGRGQGIRLIAVTGWGQTADQERARAAGFDAHLTKPVSLSELNAVFRGQSARGTVTLPGA